VITADTSGFSDLDGLGELSYQWTANGITIANATGGSYTLTQSEVGKSVAVTASYTDGRGVVESVQSSPVVLSNITPTGATGDGTSPTLVSVSGIGGSPTATNIKYTPTGSNAVYFNGTSQLNIQDTDLNLGTRDFKLSFAFKTNNTTAYSNIFNL
jgi:hypothetical protein